MSPHASNQAVAANQSTPLPGQGPGVGVSVLVVDDDRAICTFLKERLTRYGYAVRTAGHGVEALERIEVAAPDLVVTDLRMPNVDGHELMRKLKARSARMPVIVLTGHGRMPDAVEALRNGAADFIEKPFRFRSLHASIEGALAESRREQADGDAGASESPAVEPADEDSPTMTVEESARAVSLAAKVRQRLAAGTLDLPVASPVLMELRRVMEAPYTELKNVADIVERDQEVAIRVMQWANSAAHAGKLGVRNLADAVRRVGTRSVFSVAVRCVTDRMNRRIKGELFVSLAEDLSRRTLLTAEASRMLGAMAKHPNPEDLYALSLLSEVGEPFLLSVMADIAETEPEAPTRSAVEAELERHHADFGAALLRRWGFGVEMSAAAACHHRGKAIARLRKKDAATARAVLISAVARAAAEQILEAQGSPLAAGAPPAPIAKLLRATGLIRPNIDRVVTALSGDEGDEDPRKGRP